MDDASIEDRLAALEAERAVLDTLYRYGHAIDYGDEAAWVDCFTEDGVWDVRPGPAAAPGTREQVVRGADELRAFIPTHSRAPDAWHKHLLCEPRLRFDGDRCRAESYFVRVDAHPKRIFMKAFGRYVDDLVRCDDGVWRIQRRVAEIEFTDPLGLPTSR